MTDGARPAAAAPAAAQPAAGAAPAYGRILLKLSGEALMGSQSYGIDTKVAQTVAAEIKTVHDLGLEIAIVVGG